MKKLFLFVCVVGLTSCFSLKTPDYSICELYQITNNSSCPVLLTFYEQDTIKTIYADIWDGDFRTNDHLKRKDWEELWIDSFLMLGAGQTALLYEYRNPYNNPNVSPDYLCNIGDNRLHLFAYLNKFVGDSTTVSVGEEQNLILPLQNAELWENWYDEKQYIYYHFWRIE